MVSSGGLPDVILKFLQGDIRNLTFADMSARNIPGPVMIKLNRFLKGLKVKLKCRDADGYQPVRKIKALESYAADSQDPRHSVSSLFFFPSFSLVSASVPIIPSFSRRNETEISPYTAQCSRRTAPPTPSR